MDPNNSSNSLSYTQAGGNGLRSSTGDLYNDFAIELNDHFTTTEGGGTAPADPNSGSTVTPTFSTPTFEYTDGSAFGILNLPIATGSLDTSASGSIELRNQFFISSTAGGMDIAGAITNATITGAGVQITLDTATLSSYNDQTLHLNFIDAADDQTTGTLQSTDGTDISSFTQTFNYSTSASSEGSAQPAGSISGFGFNINLTEPDNSGAFQGGTAATTQFIQDSGTFTVPTDQNYSFSKTSQHNLVWRGINN